ncbi:PadR family transcriptional regulator [Micromonospora sp. WMMD1102]|uniref:PadR family transcriptional regulator n=1 Tax=Micromonospora sp. WMMD1102 TaxID=3016105 RepID=UPI00241578DF|nr:PadR family transcriptional regulator [Micromonospora sp. WMMD1102]MDG4784510.1 PadR family transcriptional regulator [Micromonospora sp. WMMD1102]
MSATRMMILGLVRWMQPVHGYDVRRELLSWSADKWANVQPGSIYHALRKLTEEGLLREVATEQVGARPARITYEITPVGEDEFQGLLRGIWWNLGEVVDPFFAAFSFLPALPREEASAALRNRARLLRAVNDSLRAAMESGWMKEGKPVHVSWMWQLSVARSEGEIAWCERIADLIDAGVPYLPEDYAEQPAWAQFAKLANEATGFDGGRTPDPGGADTPDPGGAGAPDDTAPRDGAGRPSDA